MTKTWKFLLREGSTQAFHLASDSLALPYDILNNHAMLYSQRVDETHIWLENCRNTLWSLVDVLSESPFSFWMEYRLILFTPWLWNLLEPWVRSESCMLNLKIQNFSVNDKTGWILWIFCSRKEKEWKMKIEIVFLNSAVCQVVM